MRGRQNKEGEKEGPWDKHKTDSDFLPLHTPTRKIKLRR